MPSLSRKWVIGLGILAVLAIVYFGLVITFHKRQQSEPVVFGASFSAKYARELGLEPKAVFERLNQELPVKKLRLMSYWDEHESVRDSYNFDELDWQFETARKHSKKVSLAVGLRQPRWPECHSPEWYDELTAEEKKTELLDYVTAVVERYRNHPALESYQLENEVANRAFSPHCPKFDRQLLGREYAAIKAIDSDHPLIINLSNQSGIPLKEPLGDKAGFSIYKKAYFELFGRDWYWSFWYVPAHWHALRASVLELKGTQTFIHELQAEPWGPEPTVNLTLAEQNKTMDPRQLDKIVDYALKTGMKEVYLWGAEWWYWRAEKHQDNSLLDTAERTILKHQTD